MKYLLLVLLCFVGFIRPLSTIYQQKDRFFSPGYSAQYASLKAAYYSSQYVQKKNPGVIPDETFEAFAGGFFLKGGNPILIVHDHPPLGRYFISLSILLFDNPNTLIVPFLISSLLGLFLISKMVIKNVVISLIPIIIFANEPLFLGKLLYTPLPEPIQLPFIIFAIYFFIRGISGKKYTQWFILTSIMIGFVISTRFFVTGAALLVGMFFYLFVSKQSHKKIVLFLVCLPLSLVVLVFSYAKTIQDGSSLVHVFGIQRYILDYHKSKFILPFTFWDLLLFNRWHTWWGNNAISSDPAWVLIWPISVVATGIYGILGCIKKIKFVEAEKIIAIWLIMYSLVLSVGYTSTRYFLPILPFFYILATSFLVKAYSLLYNGKI